MKMVLFDHRNFGVEPKVYTCSRNPAFTHKEKDVNLKHKMKVKTTISEM